MLFVDNDGSGADDDGGDDGGYDGGGGVPDGSVLVLDPTNVSQIIT